MMRDIYNLLRRVALSLLVATMISLFTGIHTEIGIAIVYVITYWILAYLEHKQDKRELLKEDDM